jgi:hypothetical protein
MEKGEFNSLRKTTKRKILKMNDIERKEDFKILMPKPDYRDQMLAMTQYVMSACINLASLNNMDTSKVHMWDKVSVDTVSDEHYNTFRVVVEFPECNMWLDTSVYDDIGTYRKAISTFSTVRDSNHKTLWSGYVSNVECLSSLFERFA